MSDHNETRDGMSGDNHNQADETTLHVPHDPGCCIVLTPTDATLNDPQEQR